MQLGDGTRENPAHGPVESFAMKSSRVPEFWTVGFGIEATLNASENFLFAYALMRGDGGEDRIQCSDAQRRMRRNGDPMMTWLFSLQNDVAADLMKSFVFPPLAKVLDELFPAQISRQLHATASTSSRTNRSRIEAGGAESK